AQASLPSSLPSSLLGWRPAAASPPPKPGSSSRSFDGRGPHLIRLEIERGGALADRRWQLGEYWACAGSGARREVFSPCVFFRRTAPRLPETSHISTRSAKIHREPPKSTAKRQSPPRRVQEASNPGPATARFHRPVEARS